MKRKQILKYFSIACLLVCLAHGVTANAQQVTQSETVKSDGFELLRSAKSILIRTKSVFFKPAALEQALLDREEFENWGFQVTREEADADLIIEVDRKIFSNRFVYVVLDPTSTRVLLGGKIGSLGGTVEGQIADGFIKRLKRIRPLKPANGG